MRKHGISLIQMVITIAVMVIISGTMIFIGRDYITDSKRKALDMTITNLKSEIKLYKNINDEMPVKKNEDGSPVIFDINSKESLKKVITGSVDNGDEFYEIDISLLNPVNSSEGKKFTSDDVFIIARRTNNIFYVKGKQINKEEIYHGSVNEGEKLTLIGTIKCDEIENGKFRQEDNNKTQFIDGYLQLKDNK